MTDNIEMVRLTIKSLRDNSQPIFNDGKLEIYELNPEEVFGFFGMTAPSDAVDRFYVIEDQLFYRKWKGASDERVAIVD